MMDYTAQVICLLPPTPAAPRRFCGGRFSAATAKRSVRTLGYEVRAPAETRE